LYKSSKNSSNIEGITPGDKVYLYHYNERSGMLETVPYGYQAAVDDEGYVTINILHCSSYVIYTKEADASLCLSLREQIKVTPSRITLALAEDADRGKIEVKLPITLEWVETLDMPASQSAAGGVTIEFISENSDIAEVDSNGNITAKAPGNTTIKTIITLYRKKVKKVETRITVKTLD